MNDEVYYGTAEALEAEYSVTDLDGSPFLVYHTYNNEPVSVEGFATLAAAKASLVEYDGARIEYVA